MQRQINEIEKNLAHEADSVICCSKYMQDEIASLFEVNPDSITIIPNGVEPEQFRAMPETPTLDIPGDSPVVFFIGRLVPEKGLWHLIRSFALVSRRLPEARLVIGGRGPQRPLLDELVAELGLEERVVFTGFIRDKERNYLYNRADVAVFPSLYEPFGIVALEAMATNTPVVVSDVGGLAEIVRAGYNGLKVAPGNEAEMADAIIRVLTDNQVSQGIVRNAAREIDTTYNWRTIAADTVKVYQQTTISAHRRREVV